MEQIAIIAKALSAERISDTFSEYLQHFYRLCLCPSFLPLDMRDAVQIVMELVVPTTCRQRQTGPIFFTYFMLDQCLHLILIRLRESEMNMRNTVDEKYLHDKCLNLFGRQ